MENMISRIKSAAKQRERETTVLMMSGEMKKPGETRTPCVCVSVRTQDDEKKIMK